MVDDGIYDNSVDEQWLWDSEPQDHYARIAITVVGRVPLLAKDRFARMIVTAIETCRDDVPGTLWAYTVLPDSVRLIVGPAAIEALDQFVTQFKAQTEASLLAAIKRADDDSLDAVLRFNPIWGAAIYRVWEAGYHRVLFSSEYRLSNAIYATRQLPVELDLIADAAAWPYTWVGGVV